MQKEILKLFAKMRFKFRSDTLKNWEENNPVLLEGEAGVVTGLNAVGDGLENKSQKIKFGDGIHDWNSLDWWYGSQGEGGTILVDQTYNPESENAQSGKAVAEGIELEKMRADTTFANTLKGSKSGSVIPIDDISPIAHEMSVKVRRKNLFDLTSILNASNWDSSLIVDGYGNYPIIGLIPNTDYTLSMSSNSWNGVADNGFYVSVSQEASKWLESYSICHNSGTNDYCKNTVTIKSNENGVIYFNFYNVTNERLSAFFEKCPDIQLELGTTATAYTPYIPDLTAVKVNKLRKNLFDTSKLQNVTFGTYLDKPCFVYSDNKQNFKYAPYFFENTKYTLTMKMYRDEANTSEHVNIVFEYTDGTTDYLVLYHNKIKSYTSKSGKTLSKITGNSGFSHKAYIDLTVTQFELGNTATEYEPHIEPITYTPNADGTVDGVTSLYPNTTLMADTEGVLIECEYNKDINKSFAELQQAIISLGGNV